MHIFTLALFATAVLGAPSPGQKVFSLPVQVQMNLNSGFKNIVEADRARARALAERARRGTSNGTVPIKNGVMTFTASVGVGSPPTEYNLIVDTGSSNTWVGANKPYVPTSTSKKTDQQVVVIYGSGDFVGNEFFDQVTLAKGLVFNQSIGVATSSNGFTNVDGIIGIGPTDLTNGTLSPDDLAIIPTVVDNLFSDGLIPQDIIGISLNPTVGKNQPAGSGAIDFGGIDESKVIGDVTFAPITSTAPSNQFWGINQSISTVSQTVLTNTAGIVDTGTTLTLIASDAFERYKNITGGVLDEDTGLLTITKEQFDNNLSELLFRVGEFAFALTPDAQAWPQELNEAIGGVAGKIYLIVADIGSPTGLGFDFINGQTFLQRFYSVYDTRNKQVGFATTNHTFDHVNVV